nr:YdeI/OmpD-associated family protein [Marasmitruncus massiliensis]
MRPRYPIPDDVAKALQREGLTGQYEARPPYQRNDYIGWITQAKRTQTREKRIRQMLDELRSGDIYMGMAYSAKK